MVAEHNDDEQIEQEGQEKGRGGNYHCGEFGEEGAVVVEADGALPSDEDERVRATEAYVN